MQTIVNLLGKVWGVQKLWDALDGYKLYATGAMAILAALLGLGNDLAPILSAHDTGALFQFVTHISSNASWQALLAGCLTIGAAHKAEKSVKP